MRVDPKGFEKMFFFLNFFTQEALRKVISFSDVVIGDAVRKIFSTRERSENGY